MTVSWQTLGLHVSSWPTSHHSGDHRQISLLFQRISVLLLHFNSVLLHAHFIMWSARVNSRSSYFSLFFIIILSSIQSFKITINNSKSKAMETLVMVQWLNINCFGRWTSRRVVYMTCSVTLVTSVFSQPVGCPSSSWASCTNVIVTNLTHLINDHTAVLCDAQAWHQICASNQWRLNHHWGLSPAT